MLDDDEINLSDYLEDPTDPCVVCSLGVFS